MNELIQFIADYLSVDPTILSKDSGPSSHGIEEWDSFAHLTLVMALEKKYQIRFKTEDLGLLDSVESIYSYIEDHKSQ